MLSSDAKISDLKRILSGLILKLFPTLGILPFTGTSIFSGHISAKQTCMKYINNTNRKGCVKLRLKRITYRNHDNAQRPNPTVDCENLTLFLVFKMTI